MAADDCASVGLDRVTAVVDTDLEVPKVPCFASYRFFESVEEEDNGRSVVLVQIHKQDTEAGVLHAVVVGIVGVEEEPGNWLLVGQYRSFPQRQDCLASELKR